MSSSELASNKPAGVRHRPPLFVSDYISWLRAALCLLVRHKWPTLGAILLFPAVGLAVAVTVRPASFHVVTQFAMPRLLGPPRPNPPPLTKSQPISALIRAVDMTTAVALSNWPPPELPKSNATFCELIQGKAPAMLQLRCIADDESVANGQMEQAIAAYRAFQDRTIEGMLDHAAQAAAEVLREVSLAANASSVEGAALVAAAAESAVVIRTAQQEWLALPRGPSLGTANLPFVSSTRRIQPLESLPLVGALTLIGTLACLLVALICTASAAPTGPHVREP